MQQIIGILMAHMMYCLRFWLRKNFKWFHLKEISLNILEIRRKGLRFCIMVCHSDRIVQINLVNFGLNFSLRPEIRPNIWCKTERLLSLENLYKLGLRPKFGLRTKSNLFFQVTHFICERCWNCPHVFCVHLIFVCCLVPRNGSAARRRL